MRKRGGREREQGEGENSETLPNRTLLKRLFFSTKISLSLSFSSFCLPSQTLTSKNQALSRTLLSKLQRRFQFLSLSLSLKVCLEQYFLIIIVIGLSTTCFAAFCHFFLFIFPSLPLSLLFVKLNEQVNSAIRLCVAFNSFTLSPSLLFYFFSCILHHKLSTRTYTRQ